MLDGRAGYSDSIGRVSSHLGEPRMAQGKGRMSTGLYDMSSGLGKAFQISRIHIHETASHIIRGTQFRFYMRQIRDGQQYCLRSHSLDDHSLAAGCTGNTAPTY